MARKKRTLPISPYACIDGEYAIEEGKFLPPMHALLCKNMHQSKRYSSQMNRFDLSL